MFPLEGLVVLCFCLSFEKKKLGGQGEKRIWKDLRKGEEYYQNIFKFKIQRKRRNLGM